MVIENPNGVCPAYTCTSKLASFAEYGLPSFVLSKSGLQRNRQVAVGVRITRKSCVRVTIATDRT